MNWTTYILRRIAFILASLLFLSILIFVVMEIIPGDLARTILGPYATADQVAAVRTQLGLDHPPARRYGRWLIALLTGHLGRSISLNAPIGSVLEQRAERSLVLALLAAAIGLTSAVVLGFVAGVRKPPSLDTILSRLTVLIGSLPEFLVGMFLILLLSQVVPWLPATSLAASEAPLGHPAELALPVLTLVLVMLAYNLRITRTSVIAVLNREYIITAELKGLPMRTILWRHVAPNALLPTITVAASYLGWLMGGLVVVEAIFAYPGIGLLILNAAKAKDVPLLEAAVIFLAAIRMCANLGADILYRILDPRVRIS